MFEEIQRELFAISLELGSIQIDMRFPFRWASGYMMPIYNDSRLLLSSPQGAAAYHCRPGTVVAAK